MVFQFLFNIMIWSLFILRTVFWGSLSFLASFIDGTGFLQYSCMLHWARTISTLVGSRITVTGTEKIPSRTVIIASNHLSIYDIIVLIVSIPFQFRWTAKAEVFTIPFLGWHLSRSGHIKIVRHDRHQSLAAIQKATETLRNGATVVIFPEGTRSIDGTLKPFKKGAFHMSMDSGLPIVPVTIKGSREVSKKGDWNIGYQKEITVTFHDALRPENYSKESLDEFMDLVWNTMHDALEEGNNQ